MNDQEEKEYKVPFLVLKFGQQGLRLVEGQKNVVYVESSYKVMCTFHNNSIVSNDTGLITDTPENENDIFMGKHYTSLFKQSVYWDFGDGALVKGITATHNYSKSGKYIITCYFFDKENNSYKNSFNYEVIAKEVIDTGIILKDEHKNKEINVSKITHLCPLECRLGENINYPLPIVPYKKNSKEQQSFFDLKEDDICAKELFYSFYEKSNDNIFLSEKTKKTTLTPV